MKKKYLFLVIAMLLLIVSGAREAFADETVETGIVSDSRGNPLIYGKEYYVWHALEPDIKRGGLTFEPYLSYDNLLFSNDSRANGTAQIITGKANGEVVSQGDIVKVKSTNGNWANEREWAVRQYFVSGVYNDMILKSSGDKFYITGIKVDGKGVIGFGGYDQAYAATNFVVFSTDLKARIGTQNKLWLYAGRNQVLGNVFPTTPDQLDLVYRTTRKNLEFRPVD